MGDTNIETTIYKLELDGSAYIQGVDQLSNSTKKLSDAQEKANQKLTELKNQQQGYKKALDETTAVIKANEKETLELTKDLNLLKESGKGASAEADKLKNALRGIATSTKEFKIEAAALKENLNQTTNQLKLQTKEVQAAEKATGGFTQGLQKAYTGLSRVAQLIPGLGIGALVGIIAGPLINAFEKWAESIKDVNSEQKLLNDALGSGEYQKAVSDVSRLRSEIDLAKEGFLDKRKVVDDYNKSIGKTTGLVTSLEEAEKSLNKNAGAFIHFTLLKTAATQVQEKAAKQLVDAEIQNQKDLARISRITTGDKEGIGEFLKSGEENLRKQEQDAANKRVQSLQSIADKFLKEAADLAKKFNFNFFQDTEEKKTKTSLEKQRKEAVNVYADELRKLKLEIAKLNEKGFTTEESITKAIEEDFKIRSAAFDKALAKGQLTPDQVKRLNAKLTELQQLVTATSIKAFNEQRVSLLQKIDSELSAIETEAATKRIANIQDNFERQRQTIIAESDRLITARQNARDKEIAEINKSTLLSPAQKKAAVERANEATDSLIEQFKIHTAQQLQQLSFDTFEKLSDDLQRRLKDKNFDVSALSLMDIKKQTELLQQGKISYDQYQKELTRIAKEESDKRRENEIENLRIEIGRRQAELRSNKELTEEQSVKLLDEIRSREAQLDSIERGEKPDKPNKGVKPEDNERLQKIIAYANAIGSVIDSVVAFWQKANDAESKALDRSITLQQRRVDAAQRIAERGNAQYLKAEEDRLTELEIKRENAARKQLGIDAALQASQILVAITGAVAKIATPGVGIAETIGSIAVIVGALATGYGLVRSLQGNQPTFFTGTKDTGPGGNVDGKGGFTATLHPHEAVTPADKNKAYHPTISAIHDGTIPAETLNTFVKNYHQIKPVAMPNYDKMKETAELSIGHDGRMAVLLVEHSNLLKENNELQRAILKKKGVHAELNVDKNGVGMMVTEYMEQLEINKRI